MHQLEGVVLLITKRSNISIPKKAIKDLGFSVSLDTFNTIRIQNGLQRM